MKTKLLLLSLGLFANASYAKGSGAPANAESAVDYISNRGGVSAQQLNAFFEQTKHNVKNAQPSNASYCLENLKDTNKSRDRLLACLASFQASVWSRELGQTLFSQRVKKIQSSPTKENVKTSALLSYIEDLNRQALHTRNQPASWIRAHQSFSNSKQHFEFDFQDGDVVLGLGNSSLSAIISQFNNTPSRYSHAFIVRKRKGQATTLESLVESGVKEFPWKHFVTDPYNQLTVLRWRNVQERNLVAARASDWAYGMAQNKAPYDFAMDLKSDNALYCSELVVKAYSYGSQLSLAKIVHTQSRVKNQKIFDYAAQMGVSQPQYIAPGDLLNSDKFEVVAEYRRQENLMRAWEVYIWGDSFLEKISQGAQLVPDPLFVGVPMAMWFGQLLPSMFHKDARLIPKNISPNMVSILATQEIKIFKPALKQFGRNERNVRDLLEVPVWRIRSSFENSFETNPWIRSSMLRSN